MPKCAAARVDNPGHAALEADVTGWLSDCGFEVQSNAFHSKFTPEFSWLLKRQHNLTALVVRASTDLVAVHPLLGFALCLECKTIPDPRYRNLQVEALPVALHCVRANLGARCLYVVRDTVTHFEGSFWAGDRVPWQALHVPPRSRGGVVERVVRNAFPELPVAYPPKCNGSGDPFLRLAERHVRALKPWKNEVAALTPPISGG